MVQALPTREEFVELVHSYLKTILETSDLIEEDAVYRWGRVEPTCWRQFYIYYKVKSTIRYDGGFS